MINMEWLIDVHDGFTMQVRTIDRTLQLIKSSNHDNRRHNLLRSNRKTAHHLIAIHPRHDEICYDTLWMPLQTLFQSLQTIIRHCHFISRFIEQTLSYCMCNIHIIVYHQDAHTLPFRRKELSFFSSVWTQQAL